MARTVVDTSTTVLSGSRPGIQVGRHFQKTANPGTRGECTRAGGTKLAGNGSAGVRARRGGTCPGRIEGLHAPWVSYQCHNTLGRLKELQGGIDAAEELYLKAIAEMESLRGSIRLDELQMSFGKDKYQVYENMVNLQLNKGDFYSAFNFVERSKSRTLIDLLERNLDTV